MCECLKRIHWKPVLLAGLVYAVIATVVHQLEAICTMNYYLMPEYFGAWSKIMMPTAGPPPAAFFAYSFLFTLIGGFVFAALFDLLKAQLGAAFWQRVCGFTSLWALLILALSTLPLWLLMNLPVVLIVSWFVSGMLIAFVSSMVFAKMMKK